MRRTALTAVILLAGLAGASAQQAPGMAEYGHGAASQRLALQHAANNAMAAQARDMVRAARVEYGRPQRQMR